MSRRFVIGILLATLSAPAIAGAGVARTGAGVGDSAVAPVAEVVTDPVAAPVLDRAEVRAALAEARATNLARFRAYHRASSYPANRASAAPLNVWRDDDGRLCAAATMIYASGLHEVVERTAVDANFIKLADVREGALFDWILVSGFTQTEVATIQVPFVPQPAERERQRATQQQLARTYRNVDAMLVHRAARSLEIATDRLMARPDLAARLIASR